MRGQIISDVGIPASDILSFEEKLLRLLYVIDLDKGLDMLVALGGRLWQNKNETTMKS